MYPQSYLNTFWRLELRPQVFVAMSFAEHYESRFKHVIEPAILSTPTMGKPLRPYRVDISKTGDSILTDISDGIAHSRLVLADVSTMGRDSKTGEPHRNANVMYEVGIALACRHPSEILLVRDDRDKFLFDVSTIPHVTLDFTDTETAKKKLVEHLAARLKEQAFFRDARVIRAKSSLSAEELEVLRQCSDYDETHVWGKKTDSIASWYSLGTSRLLDKGVIVFARELDETFRFQFTPLGYVVKEEIKKVLKKSTSPKSEPTDSSGEKANVTK